MAVARTPTRWSRSRNARTGPVRAPGKQQGSYGYGGSDPPPTLAGGRAPRPTLARLDMPTPP
eukprot:scaffold20_cov361-Prasinococcus_capsulatus_cf.AAC.16